MVSRSKRGQIALEFVAVYSIVLIVFILIFAVITNQRATILNAQQGSIAQIEAQEIATYIDRAVSAGSGYMTTLSLAQGPSAIPYNIYISTTGVVIVNTSTNSQPINAYAFSDGRYMQINGSPTNVNPYGLGLTLYQVPSYTGIMRISNIGGTVYIDESPVSNAGLPGTSVLSNVQESYTPTFNGNNKVDIGPSSALAVQSFTLSFWIEFNQNTVGNWAGILDVFNTISSTDRDPGIWQNSGAPGACMYIHVDSPESGANCTGPSGENTYFQTHQFYYITITGSGGTETIYVNGVQTETDSIPNPMAQGTSLWIGAPWNAGYQPFNGIITDVQFYNASISSTQVASLYGEGLYGAPVASANIVGWWPLNGNSNDYSGQNNNGQGYNMTFKSLASFTTDVLARNGTMLSNDLVVAVESNSLAGYGAVARGTTNNGIVNDVLVYNAPNTNATVYTFNDNLTTASNIIGWWPLTFGDTGNGNTVYDLSYGNANGTYSPMVSWKAPILGSQFTAAKFGNGGNVIRINATGNLSAASNNFTAVVWVKYNGGAASGCTGIFGSGGITGSGIQLNYKSPGVGSCSIAYIGGNAIPTSVNYITPFNVLNWTMVTMSWSGPANTLYLFENSSLIYSNTISIYSSTVPSAQQYYIGAESASGTNSFNGLISDVQVYSKVLSGAQITQLNAEGPTGVPIVGAGLAGWWPLAGNTYDFSEGNTGSTSNILYANANYTSLTNVSNSARVATFNGLGDISIPIGSGTLLPYNGPVSISTWFTTYNNIGQNFAYNIINVQTPHANGFNFQISASAGGGLMSSSIALAGGTNAISTLPFDFSPYTLYNMVDTYSTTGQKIYLNGVLANTISYGATHAPQIAGTPALPDNIIIGGGTTAGSYYWGQIYGIQVYNSMLSGTQVAQLYQQGPAPQSSVVLSMG